MLERSHRVSKARFDEVMKKGRASHSPFFLVRSMREPSSDVRIAAVAPVKVAKTAVARNRARRRIYEAVRPLIGKVVPGTCACVFAKAPALDAPMPALKAAAADAFVKAGLLR